MSAILMPLPDKSTDPPHSGTKLVEPLTTKLYKYIYILFVYIFIYRYMYICNIARIRQLLLLRMIDLIPNYDYALVSLAEFGAEAVRPGRKSI